MQSDKQYRAIKTIKDIYTFLPSERSIVNSVEIWESNLYKVTDRVNYIAAANNLPKFNTVDNSYESIMTALQSYIANL